MFTFVRPQIWEAKRERKPTRNSNGNRYATEESDDGGGDCSNTKKKKKTRSQDSTIGRFELRACRCVVDSRKEKNDSIFGSF